MRRLNDKQNLSWVIKKYVGDKKHVTDFRGLYLSHVEFLEAGCEFLTPGLTEVPTSTEKTQSILKMKVKVIQSCPTLCDPMDYTVHGILQARILEWVAIPFSRGSYWPRNQTEVSCITGGFFMVWSS